LATSWKVIGNPGCQPGLATSFQLVRLWVAASIEQHNTIKLIGVVYHIKLLGLYTGLIYRIVKSNRNVFYELSFSNSRVFARRSLDPLSANRTWIPVQFSSLMSLSGAAVIRLRWWNLREWKIRHGEKWKMYE